MRGALAVAGSEAAEVSKWTALADNHLSTARTTYERKGWSRFAPRLARPARGKGIVRSVVGSIKKDAVGDCDSRSPQARSEIKKMNGACGTLKVADTPATRMASVTRLATRAGTGPPMVVVGVPWLAT